MLDLEPQCLGNDVTGAGQVPTSSRPINLSWIKLIIFPLCRNWHSLFDIFNFSLPFTTVLLPLWFLLKYYTALPVMNSTHNFYSLNSFFQILSSFYWHCPLLPLYFIILFSLVSKMGCLKLLSNFIAHFDLNFHILNHFFFPHGFCKLPSGKLWVFFVSQWASINLILTTSDITEVNAKFLRLFTEF